MAPVAIAFSSGMTCVSTGVFLRSAHSRAVRLLPARVIHRGIMGEVETQAAGARPRCLPVHVRAQHLPERSVKQMRGGVIAPRGIAQRRGDFGAETSPVGIGARGHDLVDRQSGEPGKTVSTSPPSHRRPRESTHDRRPVRRFPHRMASGRGPLHLRAGGNGSTSCLIHQQPDDTRESKSSSL